MYQNGNGCNGLVYVVKEGDTLYKIAKYYDIPLVKLFIANPYVNIYNLQVGDELCVPTKENNTTITKPEEQESCCVYVAKEGDTIGDVMSYFGTDWDTLFMYNPSLIDLPLVEGQCIHFQKD